MRQSTLPVAGADTGDARSDSDLQAFAAAVVANFECLALIGAPGNSRFFGPPQTAVAGVDLT